jgi:hypothetical protein
VFFRAGIIILCSVLKGKSFSFLCHVRDSKKGMFMNRLIYAIVGSFICLGAGSEYAGAGEAWTSLFNGKDLSGWRVAAREKDLDKEYWRVEDGVILCDTGGRKDHDYIWLVSEKEYGDFDLRLLVQGYKDVPGNSGIQVRSRYVTDPKAPPRAREGWMHGPQIDIHPPAPWRTGLIYDETWETRRWISPARENWKIDASFAPRGWRWVYADGTWAGEKGIDVPTFTEPGWNELVIRCRGTKIQTFLNGVLMTDFEGAGVLDDEAHRKRGVGLKGHLALQLHGHNHLKIRFRDIRILERP